MRVKKFKDDLLSADVLVLVDCSPVEREAYFTKRGYPADEDGGQYGAICGQFWIENTATGRKHTEYYVWVESPGRFYSVMHECIHLVRRIFKDRGLKFNADNDEMIAYYHEFWFKRIWRFMQATPKEVAPNA